MKRVIILIILATLAVAGCSSSSNSKTQQLTNHSACTQLAGKPASTSAKACDSIAQISDTGGCYSASGKYLGLWQYATTFDHKTLFAAPKTTWHLVDRDFEQKKDLASVGCK